MVWLIKFAMRAMMPRSASLPGIEDTELDAFLRQLRRECEPLYWTGLVAGAVVFALTPLLTVGVPLPAFLLPRRLLERHGERLVGSKNYTLRQAAFLVRLSAGMCWGRDPKVRARFALAPYPVDPGTFRTS